MPVSQECIRQNDRSPTDCFGCAMVMAGVGLLAVAGIARLVERWRP
jgi:hypothetical protein